METDQIEKARTRAREIFNGKRANCAESVFLAIHGLVDTPLPAEVSSVLTPLGGGIATTGENCGALVGGAIALGLVYRRSNDRGEPLEEHRGRLWDSYSLFNQLPHRFREQFGSVNCRDLTGPHTYGTKACRHNCVHMVGETAAMVIELLLEAEEDGRPFAFKKTILSQAAEKTGKTVEELIEYKRRGEPFPMEETEEES